MHHTMPRGWRLLTIGLLLGWGGAAAAESGYVSDQLRVPLLKGPARGEEALRSLTAGDPLVVMKADGDWLQVRAADGQVGWLEREVVMDHKPAQVKLLELEEERKQLRERLGRGEGGGEGGGGGERIAELEGELKEARAAVGALRERLDAVAAALAGRPAPAPAAVKAGQPLDTVLAGAGLALLGAAAGALWARRRQCRDHGGFRIRLG